uniref:Small ArfGAP 1 n=1 Tax=Poecilia latipinna TaxID=48699 RepID=A0A3B3TZ21_9TELE
NIDVLEKKEKKKKKAQHRQSSAKQTRCKTAACTFRHGGAAETLLQSIQEMGNTKARQLYEANLPDSFRRPQTDQAVEFFIRDKYEKKKYYNKNAIIRSSVLVSVVQCFLCLCRQPKDGKKEKEPDRGNKVLFTETRRNAAPSFAFRSATDTPAAAASANNGSTSTNQNNDLDIFGPMVSNPLPFLSSFQGSSGTTASTPTQAPAAGCVGGGASSGSGQADLDLFSDSSSAAKAEDGTKKPLSKDSILSLYGTNSMSQQVPAAGMFMGPSQMQFPVQATPGYQAFPGMGAAVPPTTVMGAMMAQSGAAMMGPNPAMMVGMTMPNGFMGNAPATGMMGMAPRMMGPQGAPMPAGMMPAQGMYAIQPGQQAPWNMGQVNQQMSGMTLNGAGGQMAFGQPPSAMGGWAAAAGSGQTLSTQLWK